MREREGAHGVRKGEGRAGKSGWQRGVCFKGGMVGEIEEWGRRRGRTRDNRWGGDRRQMAVGAQPRPGAGGRTRRKPVCMAGTMLPKTREHGGSLTGGPPLHYRAAQSESV
jgi:hypothetical protein